MPASLSDQQHDAAAAGAAGGLFRDSSANVARIVVPAAAQPEPGDGEEEEEPRHAEALHILRTHGAVILRDAVPGPLLSECRAAVGRVAAAIVEDAKTRAATGGFDDPKVLSGEARRALGITRIAQIGAGKKNVHFDPYVAGGRCGCGGSSNGDGNGPPRHPHAVMEGLAEAAGVAGLIRAYCGEDVTLAETGLSITRPGGGGLEWHADGRAGECTAIMSVDDLAPAMGTLGLILGSHEALDRETSEDFDAEILEVVAAEEAGNGNRGRVSYAYRRGQPIVFDARMLHAAEGSSVVEAPAAVEVEEGQGQGQEGGPVTTPEGYRVILWWIYNG